MKPVGDRKLSRVTSRNCNYWTLVQQNLCPNYECYYCYVLVVLKPLIPYKWHKETVGGSSHVVLFSWKLLMRNPWLLDCSLSLNWLGISEIWRRSPYTFVTLHNRCRSSIKTAVPLISVFVFNKLWEIVAHSNNYTLFSLFARGVIVIYEATRIKNNLIQWNNAASVPEQ